MIAEFFATCNFLFYPVITLNIENNVRCKVQAFFLHFGVLATILWNICIGFAIYRTVIYS